MICALIGRFVLHWIDIHKDRSWRAQVRLVDPRKLTDQQLSDWIHGRPVDMDALPPGAARVMERAS
jgi:hypothetical protein